MSTHVKSQWKRASWAGGHGTACTMRSHRAGPLRRKESRKIFLIFRSECGRKIGPGVSLTADVEVEAWAADLMRCVESKAARCNLPVCIGFVSFLFFFFVRLSLSLLTIAGDLWNAAGSSDWEGPTSSLFYRRPRRPSCPRPDRFMTSNENGCVAALIPTTWSPLCFCSILIQVRFCRPHNVRVK